MNIQVLRKLSQTSYVIGDESMVAIFEVEETISLLTHTPDSHCPADSRSPDFGRSYDELHEAWVCLQKILQVH